MADNPLYGNQGMFSDDFYLCAWQGAKYTESQWQRLQQTLAMQYEGEMLARERKFASQLEEMTATATQLQGELTKAKAEKATLHENVLSMK